MQGDIAYLIGEWGDGSWTRPLQAALTEASHLELQETIAEALEKIQAKEG